MIPVIALVGRPNVGKSTLFNRLTRSKDAIVADLPGLTRDRKYGEGRYEDRKFIAIDTGGITGEEEGIDAAMAQQSELAMDEADIVFLVVDAQAGLTASDDFIARKLRTRNKSVFLIVNKVDGMDSDVAAVEFYRLGFENIRMTAAAHNRGVKALIEEILELFPLPESSDEGEDEDKGIRIGIIGRPNVGKSTLVNRMLGEERVVVFDQPGTTRDSVYIPYERNGKPYTLIDTAGVRRRKNIKEAVEKFSIIKTLKAIEDSNVLVMLIDAREGLVDQDMHLIGFAIEAGRALVLAVNKWDGMTPDQRDDVRRELDRRLNFLDWARIHFISAKHGTGVGDLYRSVEDGYRSAMAKWPTNKLTRLLEDAITLHQPPMVKGHRIKLRYAHQGGSNPPRIIVHGNRTDDVPGSYKRYLENTFRKALNVVGTPILFEFRAGENPYADKVNTLTVRQKAKKARMMKHVSKIKRKEKRAKKKA
ncbi:MAG: ribosome biogenesis GTPase Der [Hahellaceae bacterium]|nr:ribosome biogenesis GTPase Der [Hahellaceae bacterium]